MAACETPEEVKEWLDETRALLRAAELLVEWFTEEGDDSDEYVSFKASLDLPYRHLELLDEWLRIGDSASTGVSQWTPKRFEASQGVARVISPLLERVVNYRPDFVAAQRESEPIRQVVLLYGQFIGTFGMCVCVPTWEAYPDCAPPDWSVQPPP